MQTPVHRVQPNFRTLRPFVPLSLPNTSTTHTSVDYLHEPVCVCMCEHTLSRQSDGRRSWQCHGRFGASPSFFISFFCFSICSSPVVAVGLQIVSSVPMLWSLTERSPSGRSSSLFPFARSSFLLLLSSLLYTRSLHPDSW